MMMIMMTMTMTMTMMFSFVSLLVARTQMLFAMVCRPVLFIIVRSHSYIFSVLFATAVRDVCSQFCFALFAVVHTFVRFC